MSDKSNACCPEFNPEPWDKKTFVWENKHFIKDSVWCFFYYPLNIGSVIGKIDKKLKSAGIENNDFMCLSDHVSKWKMDIYIAVDKEVPDAENVTFSGKVLSKVYEGDYKEISKWTEDFYNYAKEENFTIKKLFMWYTVCPKCAKIYGKNHIVFLAKSD